MMPSSVYILPNCQVHVPLLGIPKLPTPTLPNRQVHFTLWTAHKKSGLPMPELFSGLPKILPITQIAPYFFSFFSGCLGSPNLPHPFSFCLLSLSLSLSLFF